MINSRALPLVALWVLTTLSLSGCITVQVQSSADADESTRSGCEAYAELVTYLNLRVATGSPGNVAFAEFLDGVDSLAHETGGDLTHALRLAHTFAVDVIVNRRPAYEQPEGTTIDAACEPVEVFIPAVSDAVFSNW